MSERISAAEYKKLVGIASATPQAPRRDRTAGREPGKMNRTEAAYAEYLEMRRHAGEIRKFDFEAIKLRLARSTFFEPDFVVWMLSGAIEIHEIKGGPIEEDARVKLKVAARLFPYFRFIVARRNGRGWTYKDVSCGL